MEVIFYFPNGFLSVLLDLRKSIFEVYFEVRLLTMAVDSIISLDDFLAVSESHIVEDVKIGIQVIFFLY